MNTRLLKVTILSVSLLTIMASAAISPALARIGIAFPEAPKTLVKLVLTLPSLVMIPFSLLSGWLSLRMNRKALLLCGLAIYLAAGVGAGFATSIAQLLVIRGVFGAGLGLIMPLSTTLIADFFAEEERQKMMGLSGAVTNIGGVLFLTASGWLACLSWRWSFAVYALALVSLLLAIVGLPAAAPRPVAEAPAVKAKPGRAVLGIAALAVLLMVAFYTVPTNLALFISHEETVFSAAQPLFQDREELARALEQGNVNSPTCVAAFAANGIKLSPAASLGELEKGQAWRIQDGEHKYVVKRAGESLAVHKERLGQPTAAGNALALMSLSGVLSGLLLARLMKWLKRFCVPVALFVMAGGFLLLAQARSLPQVFVAVPFIGFSAGLLMPSVLLSVARTVAGPGRALAMAVVSSAVYLGQFLSPPLLDAAAKLAGHDSFPFRFALVAAGLALAAVVALLYHRRAGGPAAPAAKPAGP